MTIVGVDGYGHFRSASPGWWTGVMESEPCGTIAVSSAVDRHGHRSPRGRSSFEGPYRHRRRGPARAVQSGLPHG
ncbi:hypothetical protein NGM37_28935, partial [Streptomyces sp. TRM76130]|nr:hypothetical protein [Streptomyces sp. TRM76130]